MASLEQSQLPSVLHLSHSDTQGGAGRAAYRLHHALRDNGLDSSMLVQRKQSDDPDIFGPSGRTGGLYSFARGKLDTLPLVRHSSRDRAPFSPAWVPTRRLKHLDRHDPDIAHLHWVTGGFLTPEAIARIETPIVWTVHDMWPFTGGCHYADGCTRFRDSCGCCPRLKSDATDDLSSSLWSRKHEAWDDVDFTVVAPSKWLADQVASSALLGQERVTVIPNCIDTTSFRPRPRAAGIDRFGLDESKQYVLLGADYDTPRKGASLCRSALEQLPGGDAVEVLLFGATGDDDDSFPVATTRLGRLSERDLRLAYSTADVTAVPSRADNLPNIAVESIASGTPCVAFDVGGLPDIVNHRTTGYLADPFDTEDFAAGLKWLLADRDRLSRVSDAARASAERTFSIDHVVDEYAALYESVS